MPDQTNVRALHTGRNVRLDTLVRLRWLAVIGQTIAVLVVYVGLDFDLPIWACLAVIALAGWLNVALRVRFRMSERVTPDRAAWLLAFDIAELAILLFLTGGIENPFSFLLLGPVLLSATALPPRLTLMLGGFAAACATALIFVHYSLPWDIEKPLELPSIYTMGIWLSLLLAIGFIGAYAWQLTEEARALADALAATELVLAREQHLSQLDGLAAAAAHELGTPLSTITVIAADLEREIKPPSPHAEDIALLREQAQRCRAILGKLTQLSASAEPFDRMPLSALIEETVAPHRHFGVEIVVTRAAHSPSKTGVNAPMDAGEPIGRRSPAILYGLGNLVENAVDFAADRVDVAAEWSAAEVAITISDDGGGFAAEILGRIGEPYLTGRRRGPPSVDSEAGGLGLGLFIAKTLLERSGATLTFRNRAAPQHGAVVRIGWARADFEQTLTEGGVPDVEMAGE
jgi:two-component system, sensor histidine kinase RegB